MESLIQRMLHSSRVIVKLQTLRLMNEITSHVSNEVEDESGSDTEVEIAPLRRSERQTTKPKYLEDYVLFAEEEG